MIHNTGHYGSNETPANMGAPLNISQLSTPMSMVQNMNNLAKMPSPPPSASSGHYNLPNYPSYNNSAMNVNAQMHPFQNYHSLGFQPSYLPQNPSIVQNTSWPNTMLPMGLNMHGEHTENLLNYSQIDKKVSDPDTSYKDHHYSSKTPLNIPQVPIKLFQKPPEPIPSTQVTYNESYKPYQELKDSHNLGLSIKSPETLLYDDTRRKNLENTVRLIENILINTTKNRDMQMNSPSYENSEEKCFNDTKSEETNLSKSDSEPKESYEKNDVQNDSDDEGNKLDDIPEDSDDNDVDENMHIDSGSENNRNVHEDDDKSFSRVETEKSAEEHKETEPDNDALSTVDIMPVIKQETMEEEKQVVVKIEQIASWTDTDSKSPFHRDFNGVAREDVTSENIVDSENSVIEALEVVKNGSKSDSYYECPHCSLLFQHPKRFLIHAKWHSFGLINDQRYEVAREKEDKKEVIRLERVGISTEKEWACGQCDKVYHAKASLDNHRQRYHSKRTRECKVCKKIISGGWAALKSHQSTHNKESGFQCTECPKRFKYAHSLAKHKDTHLGLFEDGYQCNECPKKFKYFQSLMRHSGAHLEKTHGCPECPKKFGSPALLKVHSKSHERARQGATFHCTFCGKSFYDKFNLQIHERTHTNERPFVCEICNATFGCNSNLSRHLKVSHSASKPHVCSTCNRSFATSIIRDRHELRVHGDPEEFKYTCKLCPSRYLKLVDLRKHTYKMHPKSKSEKSAK